MTSEINEELWYGLESDEEAEGKAAKSLAGRVGRIVGAKPFPLAARRLAQVTKNPECSIDDVVKVLEYDPALSVRLLRLVNSAGFALRTACTSVRHAAALVGLERINQVAVTAAIMDMYTPGNKLASKLLEHTTVVGALCRYLGFHFDLDVEEMFTCGFLHDIGKLMMLDTEGEEYGELLTQSGFDDHDAVHLLEREHYGFDHALLGGHVLSAWNIPDPIPKVVAWHHNVTRAYAHSSQVAQPTSVLRLADALSYALSRNQPEVEIEKIAHMEAASYLDISEPQIATMWQELQTIEQRARLVFREGGSADPAEIFSFRPSRSSLRQRSFAPVTRQDTPRPKPITPFSTIPPVVSIPVEPDVIEEPAPRLSTVPRTNSNPVVLTEPASMKPKQFPCVVCAGPSYANICPACGGYVCPEHQTVHDEWCTLCLREYREFGSQLLSVRNILIGSSVGAGCTGVLFTVTGVAAGGPLKVIGGSLLILLLALVLAVIGYSWIRRSWFLRSRPNRMLLDDMPTVSLDRITMIPQIEATEEALTDSAPASSPSIESPLDEPLPAVFEAQVTSSTNSEPAPAVVSEPSVTAEVKSEPAPAMAPEPSAEAASISPVSSVLAPPLLSIADPVIQDVEHVVSSLPPRSLAPAVNIASAPSTRLEPEALQSIESDTEPPPMSVDPEESASFDGYDESALIRVIPEAPDPIGSYALALLANVPASFPPRSLAPTSVNPASNVNPNAPTSRPPPPGSEELTGAYATVIHSRPPAASLAPTSRPPSSGGADLSGVPPTVIYSRPPTSLAPLSSAPPLSVSATAPTSRPPSLEAESDDAYTLIANGSVAMWVPIADSHGAAAGW